MKTKICTVCKIEKKSEEFSKDKSFSCGLKSACKKCVKHYNATHREVRSKYYQTHKTYYADQTRLRKYGKTPEELKQIFIDQGERCGICKTIEPKHKQSWSVDHDHKTGEVRGLLCHACNIKLYPLEDNDWLEKAKEYLQKNATHN